MCHTNTQFGPLNHFFRTAGILGCSAVLLLAAIAVAQESEPEVPQEARRYAVELIVFEYRDSESAGSEIFLPDELSPEQQMMLADSIDPLTGEPREVGSDIVEYTDRPGSLAQEESAPLPLPVEPAPLAGNDLILSEVRSPQQVGFRLLQPGEFTLDEVYEKLQRLDAYQPLMRAAWSQQTIAEAETPSIDIRRLGNPSLQLDGQVKLYLGRYLHLVLDLELQERRSGALMPDTGPDPQRDDGNRSPSPPMVDAYRSQFAAPVYYRIREDRIVRNGELRYYDHPRFGAVAKITRIDTGDGRQDTVGAN